MNLCHWCKQGGFDSCYAEGVGAPEHCNGSESLGPDKRAVEHHLSTLKGVKLGYEREEEPDES